MSFPSRSSSRCFRRRWIAVGLSVTAAAQPLSDADVDEASTGGFDGSGSAAGRAEGGPDAAGQGGSAGEAGDAEVGGDASDTGADADAGDVGNTGTGGAAGGEPCENEATRCRQGVLERGCGPKWETVVDCRTTNICDPFQNICVPRCANNSDCAGSPWAESFCRGDGRCSSTVFETIWEIPSFDRVLQLPFFDDRSGTAKCDFTVSWGDDSETQTVTDCKASSLKHKYTNAGRYHVRIKGTYIGWGQQRSNTRRCSSFDLHQLREVVSFGPVGLTEGAFYCTKGVVFPRNDVPDSSLWNNAANMFCYASGISSAIDAWDTSNVTTMRKMFFRARYFNVSLAKWDISRVETMESAFHKAASFDQDLSPWSLKPDVVLNHVFKRTRLSKANYCAIASLPVWRDKLSSLGVSYSCSP